MESFKQWMLSLCGATVITGILQIFLSNSYLKKSINVFLSVFILFFTLIPLSGMKIDSFEYDFDNMNLSEVTEDGYEQIIVSAIEEICCKNSVDVLSINVDSYISDNYLCVNEILIEINEPEKSNFIEGVLKKELGFEVNVV